LPFLPQADQRLRDGATKLPEPVRFCIVGGIGFVVDALVLSSILAVVPSAVLAARVPSFLVAATVTWWLHRAFTFAHVAAPASSARQWLAFVFTNGAGNALNVAIYALLATFGGMRPVLALATASIVAATVNYLASRHLVFRRRVDRNAR
jgi:putative flippase GtrA